MQPETFGFQSSPFKQHGSGSLEVQEVRFLLENGALNHERAQRIARLTFEFAHEFLVSDLEGLAADLDLDWVIVNPVHASFETMDDETIARASAAEIRAALFNALEG